MEPTIEIFKLTNPDFLLKIVATVVLVYFIVIVISRINGLRSYATINTFDFAIVVAIGSVAASGMMLQNVTVTETLVAMAVLLVCKSLVAILQQRSDFFYNLVNNSPVLLVYEGEVFYKNLKYVRITEEELVAKMRENGVAAMSQVQAAIMESTGVISVIKVGDEFDEKMLGSIERPQRDPESE